MNKTSGRIDQLLTGLADGDATSHAAFAMRDALRTLGYASDIYAVPELISASIRDACRDISTYVGGDADYAIHHYGMYSASTDQFMAARARKILLYHNVTPASYFRGYSDDMVARLEHSRSRLAHVGRACEFVWADSAYNARELEALGVQNVRVLPLPFVSAPLDIAPDPIVHNRLQAPLTTILSVGRVAPNKRIEVLLEAYAWYAATINPYSRLLIVGSNRSAPKYFTYLRMLADDLGVPNICFEGFASAAGLVAYYEIADLFVCTSEHEGYCLPLREAMHKGVPVISRNTGGTPEAMNNSGILYDDLTPRQLAELMNLAISDRRLRTEVLQSQQRRMEAEQQRNLAAELADLLNVPRNT